MKHYNTRVKYMKRKRLEITLETDSLFGGLAGASLELESAEITPGLTLRQTYAHIFGPLMAAFRRPSTTDSYHPGPWVSVGTGPAWDIEIEIALDRSAQLTEFDRLKKIWFATALIRLRTGIPIRLPIISPIAFHEVAFVQQEPLFLIAETQSTQLRQRRIHSTSISVQDIEWIKQYFVSGAALMSNEYFGAAFMMLDESVWVSKPRAGILLAWGAIECALRPGRRDTGNRLARIIASLLESQRPDRTRLFQKVKQLYDTRGKIIHAGVEPDINSYFETFELAQRVFISCFESTLLPEADDLEREWKAGEAGLRS